MSKLNTITENEIKRRLEILKEVPERNPHAASSGRARFLAQIEEISKQAVSLQGKQRHSGWVEKIRSNFIQRKEHLPMLTQLLSVILILSALLGGGGAATVYASQSSLPGNWLYPVKIWSEDMRSDLADSPDTQIELQLQFAERRVEELAELVGKGQPLPEIVALRLESQVNHALQLAAGLQAAQMSEELSQIRRRLMTQLQVMEQLHSSDPQAEALLTRTRQMLQTRLRLVEEGIQSPNSLHQQLKSQDQSQQNQDQLQQQDRDRLQQQDQERLQQQDQQRDQLRQQTCTPQPQNTPAGSPQNGCCGSDAGNHGNGQGAGGNQGGKGK
jgi:hypothetical protein